MVMVTDFYLLTAATVVIDFPQDAALASKLALPPPIPRYRLPSAMRARRVAALRPSQLDRDLRLLPRTLLPGNSRLRAAAGAAQAGWTAEHSGPAPRSRPCSARRRLLEPAGA